MFVTGGLLFGVHAEKAYLNVFFRIKMLLLAAAGVNAAVYQVRYYPSMADWDAAADVPLGARAIAALSLLFWIGAITCGRTMAYEL
jgi:hypothetical protein